MKIPILRIPYDQEDISFIKNEVEKVLRSGYLTMADNVAKFETEFAAFCGVKHALGTNSGTSSLEIVLRAIDVVGATVVVPSNTFMATPISVVHAGGKVVFTDCERDNLQMDPDDLKRKIRKDTKAVIIVHIGGIISPRFEEIKRICKENGLFLLEDAAHAHGAAFKGTKAGNLGDAGSFSFYPTKVMTTAEGGMITTSDNFVYEQAIILREHGKKDHSFNVHTEFGYNWRFSEIHAVLGLQQMRKIGWILAERKKIASFYDQNIKRIKKLLPLRIASYVEPAYYKYVCFLADGVDRATFKNKLKEKYEIILPGEVYSDPCHSQPVFEKYPQYVANDIKESFPNTDYVCRQQVCLPLYPGLRTDELEYIMGALEDCLK
ncbi:DegT/DnrJ/EryC1/StrS family aminotransferase [Patescibacteria group bacterium]|nr:DegT/DnrJ/EryC1/StrS family aminotransferase [Patescibacteria group bacterium]